MFKEWSDPIPDAERDAILDKLACFIKRKKLEAPAVLFLESHKPLSYIGSQAGIAFSPFLVPFLGYENVRDYTRLMQDQSNIDRLIDLLAEPDPLEPTPQELN